MRNPIPTTILNRTRGLLDFAIKPFYHCLPSNRYRLYTSIFMERQINRNSNI